MKILLIEDNRAISKGLVYTLEQIETIDFRPLVMKEIMKEGTGKVLHLVMKE